jgi:Family of unknown function (DUF6412)
MVAPYAGWELLAALWHLAPLTARPAELLAGTAAAVALLLTAAVVGRLAIACRARCGSVPGNGGVPVRRRDREVTTRYTDPDAPGRARPRAPCAALSAAAAAPALVACRAGVAR